MEKVKSGKDDDDDDDEEDEDANMSEEGIDIFMVLNFILH